MLQLIPETKQSADTFYPTPVELAEKLADHVDWRKVQAVLEPSAGKGDLAHYAAYKRYIQSWKFQPKYEPDSNLYMRELDMDCIEIDPNLRAVLKDKDYRVVHDNFLTYSTRKRYDLIIMNPPFDSGAKHLLKALSMVKYGGQVACILNAQTIKNPFSYERQQLVQQLNAMGAVIDYVSGGFSNAERKTDVEVAIVYVNMGVAKQEESILLDDLRRAHKFTDTQGEAAYTALAKGDYIDAIVDRCNFEIDCCIKLIQEYRAIAPIIRNSVRESEYSKPILELTVAHGHNYDGASINECIKKVRKKYWQALFENPEIWKQLTNNLQNDLQSKVNELAEYEFSAYNIYTLMQEMNSRVLTGIEATIMDLFDEWTIKYHWDEMSKNKHYFNGWRTNDAFAVNKRIIFPCYDVWDHWDGKMHLRYGVEQKLCDIEKVFNYLDGGLTLDPFSISDRLDAAELEQQSKKIPTKYFYITFYKKGTCHLEFRNPDLLAKFNIFAARHKKWLPPAFGKKQYSDLDAEEKDVVDSFIGESAYNQVVSHHDYYLSDASEMVKIGS